MFIVIDECELHLYCPILYFDFYQYLLSFPDEIVGVELLHHVSPENFDGAQLGDV